jgi:hypothetical protein
MGDKEKNDRVFTDIPSAAGGGAALAARIGAEACRIHAIRDHPQARRGFRHDFTHVAGNECGDGDQCGLRTPQQAKNA